MFLFFIFKNSFLVFFDVGCFEFYFFSDVNIATPTFIYYFFSLFKILFIFFWLHWVFIAACRLFSSCGVQGLLFVAVHGLLISVASLVSEHRL